MPVRAPISEVVSTARRMSASAGVESASEVGADPRGSLGQGGRRWAAVALEFTAGDLGPLPSEDGESDRGVEQVGRGGPQGLVMARSGALLGSLMGRSTGSGHGVSVDGGGPDPAVGRVPSVLS